VKKENASIANKYLRPKAKAKDSRYEGQGQRPVAKANDNHNSYYACTF